MKKAKGKSKKAIVIFAFFVSLCLCASVVNSTAQTGGQFAITQSVIASGGGSNSIGGNFIVDGTTGQNLAGTTSTGSGFNLQGGFWTSQASAPTASSALISGRILTADGTGIRNVRITLTNAVTGEVFSAISSSFGYYCFEEVTVGQMYILTVSAKRFVFNPDTRLISLTGDLIGTDFIAIEQ